jgi:hypothetical protein
MMNKETDLIKIKRILSEDEIFNHCSITYLERTGWCDFAIGISFKSKEVAEEKMSEFTRRIRYEFR